MVLLYYTLGLNLRRYFLLMLIIFFTVCCFSVSYDVQLAFVRLARWRVGGRAGHGSGEYAGRCAARRRF